MTMDYQYINVERDGRLFLLTINRPEVMNAISPAASHEMAAALDEFEADEDLWLAVITGAGSDAFCAGGDISVMAERILRCAPLAVRATKQCVLRGLDYAGVPAAQRAQEQGAFPALQVMLQSEDTREGLNAFLEKRRPNWQGR